jgi:hypothetical protein
VIVLEMEMFLTPFEYFQCCGVLILTGNNFSFNFKCDEWPTISIIKRDYKRHCLFRRTADHKICKYRNVTLIAVWNIKAGERYSGWRIIRYAGYRNISRTALREETSAIHIWSSGGCVNTECVLCIIVPCGIVVIYQRLGGTYCFQLQGALHRLKKHKLYGMQKHMCYHTAWRNVSYLGQRKASITEEISVRVYK